MILMFFLSVRTFSASQDFVQLEDGMGEKGEEFISSEECGELGRNSCADSEQLHNFLTGEL